MPVSHIEARDIMTTQLVTVCSNEHVLDGIDRLLKHGISGAPVLDAARSYCGVFSEKSCLRALARIDERREERCDSSFRHVRAGDFMQRRLITVGAETDAFHAIGLLLDHHVSGLPVVTDDGEYLGGFSEHSAMRLIMDLAWNQCGSSPVSAWMDRDRNRIITEHAALDEVRQRFRETHYRRLPVVHRGKLVGQVSRRDVLRAELDQIVTSYGQRTGSLRSADSTETSQTEFEIRHFTNPDAMTIREDDDLMSIAQRFHATSGRRFPVVANGNLVGQVSRRDLLRSVRQIFPDEPAQHLPLYLSSVESDVQAVL